jgi:uncharacterized protein (TIGR03067 family)
MQGDHVMSARFRYVPFLACLALAGIAIQGATAPAAEKSAAAEDEALNGKWTAVEHDYDGKPWPGKVDAYWVFQGGKAYSVHGPLKGMDKNARYNPNFVTVYDRCRFGPAKTPRELDLTVVLKDSHPRAGQKPLAGMIWKHLYEIRDGKLILCYSDHAEIFRKKEADGKLYDESTRPPALDSAGRVHQWLFKRVEPGSAEDIWSPSDMEEQVSAYEVAKPAGQGRSIRAMTKELSGTWEVIDHRSWGHVSDQGKGNRWVFENGKLFVRRLDDSQGWLARYDQLKVVPSGVRGLCGVDLFVDAKAQEEEIRSIMQRAGVPEHHSELAVPPDVRAAMEKEAKIMASARASMRAIKPSAVPALCDIQDGKLIWAQGGGGVRPKALASTNLGGGVDLWVLKRVDLSHVWTGADGKPIVKAEYVGMRGNSVILKKEDGKRVEVPTARLSREDQELVEEL